MRAGEVIRLFNTPEFPVVRFIDSPETEVEEVIEVADEVPGAESDRGYTPNILIENHSDDY